MYVTLVLSIGCCPEHFLWPAFSSWVGGCCSAQPAGESAQGRLAMTSLRTRNRKWLPGKTLTTHQETTPPCHQNLVECTKSMISDRSLHLRRFAVIQNEPVNCLLVRRALPKNGPGNRRSPTAPLGLLGSLCVRKTKNL